MGGVLKANIDYLQKLSDILSGKKISLIEYKLVRKELFVSTANLAAAFHRMLSEPKSKQHHGSEIYEFVVLNHVLSSNIAALAESLSSNERVVYSKEIFQPVKRSVIILEKSLRQLDKNYGNGMSKKLTPVQLEENKLPDKHLTGQLNFIYKIAEDIAKVTEVIAG